MHVKTYYIDKLLFELASKTQTEMTFKGFETMAEIMGNQLGGKYLYEYLHRKNEKAKSEAMEHIPLNLSKLNLVATFLGYKSFTDFCDAHDRPLDEVIISLQGNYYCYVRRNSVEMAVLRSPVRIDKGDNCMMMELTGPIWNYRGEVRLENGCLLILLKSPAGKEFHHVYKVGKSIHPLVLQGTFSGLSTSFDPIAGRVVLIRQEIEWNDLKRAALSMEEIMKVEKEYGKYLLKYFRHYESNNLKIHNPMTFTRDDLL